MARGNMFGFPGLNWGRGTTAGKGGSVAPRGPVIVPRGKQPRWTRFPQGVEASTSQMANLGRVTQGKAVKPQAYGTTRANVVNPLFGRPGFSYTPHQPHQRLGPSAKLAPGTGLTGVPQSRSEGFIPSAYAGEQFLDVNQYDYMPATDPTVGPGHEIKAFDTLPRSIGVGDDGISMLGTYRAHDFVIPSRFFQQGRSAAYWQDQSFGPEYRYLIPAQQVARYNLYTDIALARQLSPNAYFLPYQTQPAVASQVMNGNGMGRPLGY